MNDHRFKALSIIRGRLVRARATLRDTLAAQQQARERADAQLADQQAVLARAVAEVERREAAIDSLLDGRHAVRIDALLHWETMLADARAQRARELETLQQRRDGVSEIEQQLAATRAAIVRHDVRIDLCRARLDRLREAAEALADDAQDEESEEAFAARRLAGGGAARKPAARVAR